jgi:SAM-dependent methyltransferase
MRGGRWEPAEFIRTGERDVERLHQLLITRAGAMERFQHVLDFGCGVGRLSRAWGRRADHVTGIDISPGMLATGRELLRDQTNVELVLNANPDLRQWPDSTFDLVFSYICLQHMPWSLAAVYLAEFARVCRPGQLVTFQLPARRLGGSTAARLRQRIVDLLPFGLDRTYRRWRHGSSAVFEMFYTSAAEVEECAIRVGLKLIHKKPDHGAGPGTEGYFYAFRKPDMPDSASIARQPESKP